MMAGKNNTRGQDDAEKLFVQKLVGFLAEAGLTVVSARLVDDGNERATWDLHVRRGDADAIVQNIRVGSPMKSALNPNIAIQVAGLAVGSFLRFEEEGGDDKVAKAKGANRAAVDGRGVTALVTEPPSTSDLDTDEEVSITLNRHLAGELRRLEETGFYGVGLGETCERLLCEALLRRLGVFG